jgi:glycosyltransferase involved in cell wall biosynthesis
MWNFLLAIDRIGPADLVVLAAEPESGAELLAERLPAWNVRYVPLRSKPGRRILQLRWVLRRKLPFSLAFIDVDVVRPLFREMADSHRLILAIQPIAAVVAMQSCTSDNHLVVDLWDIEDVRLARQIAAQAEDRRRQFPRSLWESLKGKLDIRAWREFHKDLTETADAVTVCSEVDRASMPSGSCTWVIPNGADVEQSKPLARRSGPPVVIYHGQLTYPPNVDAAHILVEEVLPILQAVIPDLRIRLVGRTDNRVLELHAPPAVTVTGFVEHIKPELDGAHLLVVPLRIGGGTRLKILEAFARRLPVVSTSVGAEGLDVEHGRHLLIADDPADIAACTLRLLHDDAERMYLTDEADKLVRSRYDWKAIQRDLADRLNELIAGQSTQSQGLSPDAQLPGQAGDSSSQQTG